MALAVFPVLPGLSWDVEKAPEFATKMQRAASGREARVAYWTYPLWHFTLSWDVLRDDPTAAANTTPASPAQELRQLMGFFLQRRGSFEPFWYSDPSENAVTAQTVSTATPAGQTDYALLRSYGGFVEPIGAVNAITALKLNGSTQSPSSYTINVPFDGWVRFNSAPTAGSTLAWDGSYYHRVRFAPDRILLTNFLYALWNLRRVEMVTAKA